MSLAPIPWLSGKKTAFNCICWQFLTISRKHWKNCICYCSSKPWLQPMILNCDCNRVIDESKNFYNARKCDWCGWSCDRDAMIIECQNNLRLWSQFKPMLQTNVKASLSISVKNAASYFTLFMQNCHESHDHTQNQSSR